MNKFLFYLWLMLFLLFPSHDGSAEMDGLNNLLGTKLPEKNGALIFGDTNKFKPETGDFIVLRSDIPVKFHHSELKKNNEEISGEFLKRGDDIILKKTTGAEIIFGPHKDNNGNPYYVLRINEIPPYEVLVNADKIEQKNNNNAHFLGIPIEHNKNLDEKWAVLGNRLSIMGDELYACKVDQLSFDAEKFKFPELEKLYNERQKELELKKSQFEKDKTINSSIKYEECPNPNWKTKNNYIDRQIVGLLKKNSTIKTLVENPFEEICNGVKCFDKACSYHALHRMEVNSNGMGGAIEFRKCSMGEEGEGVAAPRPCINENYHKLAHNSFMTASKCFDIDPQVISAKIMIEGQFHPNAIAKDPNSSAGGPGQVTGGWIKDMETKHWESYLEYVENMASGKGLLSNGEPASIKQKEACKLVLPFMNKKMDSSLDNICSRIRLPENPMLNYVLSFAKYFESQKDIIRPIGEVFNLTEPKEVFDIRAQIKETEKKIELKEIERVIAEQISRKKHTNDEVRQIIRKKVVEDPESNLEALRLFKEKDSELIDWIVEELNIPHLLKEFDIQQKSEILDERYNNILAEQLDLKKKLSAHSLNLVKEVHRLGRNPDNKKLQSLSRILTELAMYAHNAGKRGMEKVFEAYLDFQVGLKGEGEPFTYEEFTGADPLTCSKKLSSQFASFMYHRVLSSQNRREEISNYIFNCVNEGARGRNDNVRIAVDYVESLGSSRTNKDDFERLVECSVY